MRDEVTAMHSVCCHAVLKLLPGASNSIQLTWIERTMDPAMGYVFPLVHDITI